MTIGICVIQSVNEIKGGPRCHVIFSFIYLSKVGWRITVSPKMSSLALEDVQEETLVQAANSFAPDLHVISRHRSNSSTGATTFEDVVQIGGRFTISF